MKNIFKKYLLNGVLVLSSIIMLFPLGFFWMFCNPINLPETVKVGMFFMSLFSTIFLLTLNFCALEKIKRKINEEALSKVMKFKPYISSEKELMFTMGEHK